MRVTITLEDTADNKVLTNLEILGKDKDKKEIKFTPAVVFAESFMRCVGDDEAAWRFAKLFVPEAFENELTQDKE